MNRSRVTGVLLLALVGLTVRVAIFRDVVVNGDTGLYLYDAKQLLWGRRLMVDYPSRSPVFEYALAGVVWLGDSPLLAARTFMIVLAVALGIAIYAVARELHSHRAGLVAAGIYYLLPFSVTWSLWVKTEGAAELVALGAFLLALVHADRDRLPNWLAVALGLLFATGFLIRRVWVVHIVVFGLVMLWYRWSEHDEILPTVRFGIVLAGSLLLSLGAAFVIVAGDVALGIELFDRNVIHIFSSDGRGSLGWTQAPEHTPSPAPDEGGLLSAICQKCGAQTVVTMVRTIGVTLPLWLLLFPFLRSFVRSRGRFVGDELLPVAMGVIGVGYLYKLTLVGNWWQLLAVGVGLGTIALVWSLPPIAFDDLWTPRLAFVVAVPAMLAVGYLYRERILYPTYFQDFVPWLAVLAGITSVELWRVVDPPDRRTVAAVAAVLLVVATGVAAANVIPYQPSRDVEDSAWFTVDAVEAYGADMRARTAPGERVLTAQPLYVIESDRRIAGHISRKYYVMTYWPNTTAGQRIEGTYIRPLAAGDVPYVVVDHELTRMMTPPLRRILATDYCRVDARLYEKTDGQLYEHRSRYDGACRGYNGTLHQ